MPLFKIGNFDEIGLSVSNITHKNGKPAKSPGALNSVSIKELSPDLVIPDIGIMKSKYAWSLYLKSITLFESFEGLLNCINPNNEIYFTAIAWDYSGKNPYIFPPTGVDLSSTAVKMKNKQKREFVGNGIQLWPSQSVEGSLNVVIIVHECDKDFNNLGQRLDDIHQAIENSTFAKLIKSISANPIFSQVGAVTLAVNEVIGIIGKILKTNGDDYVDLFEGSFGTERPQTSGTTAYTHESSSIELEFFVNDSSI